MSFLIYALEKVFKTNYPGGVVKKNIRCTTRIESKTLENWITLNLTWDGMLLLDLEIGYDFIKVSTEEQSESGFGILLKHEFYLDPETWAIKTSKCNMENKLVSPPGSAFSMLWGLEDILNSERSETVYEAFGEAGMVITPHWVWVAFVDHEVAHENGIEIEYLWQNEITKLFAFQVTFAGSLCRIRTTDFDIFMLRFWVYHQSRSFGITPGKGFESDCPQEGGPKVHPFDSYRAYLKRAKALWKVRQVQDPFL